MAYRSSVNSAKDKKIYHATAAKTKKINVAPKTMRGGIRL